MWKKALLGTAFVFVMFILGYQGEHDDLLMEKPMKKTVEIKGQVYQPGVYELSWEATLADALAAAGGIREEGDLSGYNQTKQLTHGEVIVIPEKTSCISINSASEEELDRLPGVGRVMAKRIIEERQRESFKDIEDVKRVKGIGDKTFEKLKDQICL